MTLALVVGARPNFVKIAAIVAAIRQYPDLHFRLIHTGQHYDRNMSDSFFRDLDIPEPDVNLNAGSDSAAVQTAEIMIRLAPVLAADRPDLVLVVGDVNSTLAGALVAVKMGIAVAHVEAGLRSFDRAMPEEINRILTDAIADHCFTSEPSANDNLRREGVAEGRIHHVGNVMIDTLFRFRERAAASAIRTNLGLGTGAFALLTLHRPSNVDAEAALAGVLGTLSPIGRDVPVVFPVHPRTRQRLERVLEQAPMPWLRLVEPQPYLDFVHLMSHATVVLTDSGGVQEETTALGVPCLTLRTTTERPITVTAGTNRLTGVDAGAIRQAWDQIRQKAWPIGSLPEMWDGKAADRVVKVLLG
jgi:UDP-N-acetylglucosamine 2-epimerase (non-hydrolysing)